MGEAKRRASREEYVRAMGEAITQAFASRGAIIEGGWHVFLDLMKPPPELVADYKIAFYGGAQHLWASIINVMSGGSEPTPRDLAILDGVSKELEAWAAEHEASIRFKNPEGSA